MSALNDYLNKAAEVTGSDRQTAFKLGITPQYLSTARARGSISNPCIIKLATLIDVNLAEMFLRIESEKTEEKEIKKAVQHFLQKIGKNVAAALLICITALPIVLTMPSHCLLC